jgi:site-specific recombinase XerD
MKPTDFALRLRAFLTSYLPTQRKLSPNTISGYRYAFVLLLRYCNEVRGLRLEQLQLEQLDAALVVDFLEHLEHERGCSPSTRNHRLAAIHSFFRYVQTEDPQRLVHCQRVLAIPQIRISHADPTYLSVEDLAAVLAQPDRSTRSGRRDAVLLSVLYDTGARVQELIDLRVEDVRLDTPAMVRLMGKGRKVRLVPLMASTAKALMRYRSDEGLDESAQSNESLFRNQRGAPFSRWGVRYLLKKYTDQARASRPTLPASVTPHTLRHTKAMHLLRAGNPAIVIRDILGHADIESTEIYAKADLEMKRRALEKTTAAPLPPGRWSCRRQPDLLRWLQSL